MMERGCMRMSIALIVQGASPEFKDTPLSSLTAKDLIACDFVVRKACDGEMM